MRDAKLRRDVKTITDSISDSKDYLERAGQAYSSIIAICEMIHPTLHNVATEQEKPTYFERDKDTLVQNVLDRDELLYESMIVFKTLSNFAMDLDSYTARITSDIEDIEQVNKRLESLNQSGDERHE